MMTDVLQMVFHQGDGWMPWLEAAAKGMLLPGLGFLMALLLSRHRPGWRYGVWVAVFAWLLLLPVTTLHLPGMSARSLPSRTFTAAEVKTPAAPFAHGRAVDVQRASPEFETRRDPAHGESLHPALPSGGFTPGPEDSLWRARVGILLALAWLTGCVWVLLSMLIGGVRLGLLRRRATPLDSGHWSILAEESRRLLKLRSPPLLLVSDRVTLPVTWGHGKPFVLLPVAATRWPLERARMAVLHELAHRKRGDGLVQIFVQTACALHWFNPLVWMARRSLIVEREKSCDEWVLRKTAIKPSEYASGLVEIVSEMPRLRFPLGHAMAMGEPGSVEDRVRAILRRPPSVSWQRRSIRLGLCAFSFFVLGTAILVPLRAERVVSPAARPETAGPALHRDTREQRLADSLQQRYQRQRETIVGILERVSIFLAREIPGLELEVPGADNENLDEFIKLVLAHLNEIRREYAGAQSKDFSPTARFVEIDNMGRELQVNHQLANYLANRWAEAREAVPAQTAEGWRFRSLFSMDGDIRFSLHHAEKDLQFWGRLGESRHGIEILGFDSVNNILTVRYDGTERRLPLEASTAGIASRPDSETTAERPVSVDWRLLWESALEESPRLRELAAELEEMERNRRNNRLFPRIAGLSSEERVALLRELSSEERMALLRERAEAQRNSVHEISRLRREIVDELAAHHGLSAVEARHVHSSARRDMASRVMERRRQEAAP